MWTVTRGGQTTHRQSQAGALAYQMAHAPRQEAPQATTPPTVDELRRLPHRAFVEAWRRALRAPE